MTYLTFKRAVPGFQKLARQDLPIGVSYKLFKLIRRINDELGFFTAREEELREKHEYRIPVQEYNELLNFTVEWNGEKIDIPLDANITLSCADLEALEPFINFKEVNENAQNQ